MFEREDISQTKEDISQIKNDLKSVSSELIVVKRELINLKNSLKEIKIPEPENEIQKGIGLKAFNTLKTIDNKFVIKKETDKDKILEIFIAVDANCPYCKKLYKDIPKYKKRGIELNFVFTDFLKTSSLQKALHIFCGYNRNAFDYIMSNHKYSFDNKDVSKKCADNFQKQKAKIISTGMNATPYIVFSNGYQISGYNNFEDIFLK